MRRFVAAIAALLFSTAAHAKLHVIIDPGHGGKDHGAVRGNLKESEITLSVAKELAETLASDGRFTASLTRDTDRFLTLGERSQVARQLRGDILVSIHVNSNKDTRAHGVEIYFQNQLPPDEESMLMAARENLNLEPEVAQSEPELSRLPGSENLNSDVGSILQDLLHNDRIYRSSELAKSLRQSWKGNRKGKALSIRQAPFFVVSNVNIPSALVEIGFLTQPQEAQQLASPAYQKTIALSLRDGLARFKESLDKQL